MEFQQRDIVLVHFPFTDLSQTKLRPALIVSANQAPNSTDFVCVQITSRLVSDSLFMPLEKDMIEGSLLLVSGIRLNKIFCLNEKLVVHKIAALTPSAFQLVLENIKDKIFSFKN